MKQHFFSSMIMLVTFLQPTLASANWLLQSGQYKVEACQHVNTAGWQGLFAKNKITIEKEVKS